MAGQIMNKKMTERHILADNPEFDVVVIGGGINGISVFRELALQGVKVLLAEKDDFCSKASAAPSRMIHGGLRYLENGEFALVKEALFERNRLLDNAPHLVAPLETTIPIYSTWSGIFDGLFKFLGIKDSPSQRGSIVIRLGLNLYDWFTRKDQKMPVHQAHSGHATKQRWPLMGSSVRSSATYFDAWIRSPERLAIELIQEGVAAGGTALNYTSLSGFDDLAVSLIADTGEQYQVRTKHLVNATGAWVDLTNGLFSRPSQYMQGTKGSHIIVDNPRLLNELDGNMLFYENSEGRVCILFPYFGKVLIGSTDIPVSDPDSVRCTDEEIDYILESLRGVLPQLEIDRSQIVFHFCGVRPLPSVNASTTGQIPRSHSLKIDSFGDSKVYSLIGGKWTTFRAFGEEVADQILSNLNKVRTYSTKQKKIGGGQNYPTDELAEAGYLNHLSRRYSNYSAKQLEIWFSRYGTGCEELLDWLAERKDRQLDSVDGYTRGEIQYITEHEFVKSTLDVLLRRTSIAIEGKVSKAVLDEISDLMAEYFNWTEVQQQTDKLKAEQALKEFHGVDLNRRTEKASTPMHRDNRNSQQLLSGDEYVFNQ